MRQLGLFEYQDLKEFTKWDFGCEISGEGGTLAKKNSGCRGRPDVMAATGIPDAICPDGMEAGEFQMRYVWMEMVAQEDFGCETPDWKWRRRRNSGCDMS